MACREDVIVGTPARYGHGLADGRIQCDVCPRACRLHDGQRGLCFVRARRGAELVLTTWGRSSGFCVDPIEKKPLNHFLPGTAVLSFGTAGCNLTCRFCQNWDISKARAARPAAGRGRAEAIAAAAVRAGCRSVAYTYNDPVIFLEYAVDVAEACRARGVRNVAVSAGYVCAGAACRAVPPHGRRQHRRLKAFTAGFYRKLCTGALQPVLDTLVYLRHETRVWLEVTTLLIPGHNDDPAETAALCAWSVEHLGADVPLHFSAFHPDYRMLDVPHTPAATLRAARRIALAHGLRHVYTGNVQNPSGQSTWCHGCGRRLIGRAGYAITGRALDEDGRCRSCGTRCPGVLEPRPGSWGPRRMPLAVAASPSPATARDQGVGPAD